MKHYVLFFFCEKLWTKYILCAISIYFSLEIRDHSYCLEKYIAFMLTLCIGVICVTVMQHSGRFYIWESDKVLISICTAL